jgi:predicted RNA-binding Zn-ribbon protein involved in translation (DUF1610 family)
MGIVVTIVCIFIFVAYISDFRKDREHKELLDTIKSTKTSEDMPKRFPCPDCAEMVLVQAKVCRYCGRDLDVPVDVKPEIFAPSSSSPELSNHPMRKLGRLIGKSPLGILPKWLTLIFVVLALALLFFGIRILLVLNSVP